MTPPLRFDITGIGLLGPGLASWAAARPLLRDPQRWSNTPTVLPPPLRLPPTERRRAGNVVKASIVVADEACAMGDADPSTLATVFTSSTGDPANCHAMCEALAQPQRMVSPTRFTNSVHNATAGYWHIATRSRQASTSLCAFDASFGAGLLEAATQCLASGREVLLVACDLPYPAPLNAICTVSDTFALALLISPPAAAAGAAGVVLALAADSRGTASRCTHAELDQVRQTIPAARALPLLQALAGDAQAAVSLAMQDDVLLHLSVTPSV
jgi:hypothetical protein